MCQITCAKYSSVLFPKIHNDDNSEKIFVAWRIKCKNPQETRMFPFALLNVDARVLDN